MARILLAEDDQSISDCLVMYLGSLGHSVTPVMDGIDALRLIKAGTQFDLIITDNEMKTMTGVQLIKTLKQIGYNRKIVMVTASRDLADFADYIVFKPYELDCFEAAIEFALEENRQIA